MDLLFVPSLRHLSLSKYAIILINQDLKSSMHRIKYSFISGTDETNVRPVEAAIEKGKQVIFNLEIPDTLKGELIDVLVSTVEMIMEWYGDHRYFLRSYFDDLYSFHWTLEGAIDRLKTAQALVQRKDALESLRFKLATAYCLEADVLRLWTRSFETCVWQFFKGQTSHGHAIWHSYWYKYGHNFRYYSGKIPGHLLNYPDSSLWPLMAKNESQLQYILQNFVPESEKSNVLKKCAVNNLSKIDIMRFCFSRMTESDVEKLFRTEDAAMSFLRSLLKWPYQSLFLRAANQLCRFISKGNFIVLLYAIDYYKRNKCHFKYNELLIEFWNLSPPHLREGERRPF